MNQVEPTVITNWDLIEEAEKRQANRTPFVYEVRTKEIVEELLQHGFTVSNYIPGCWTVSSPEDLSITKARKLISTVIQLYTAAKDVGRAKTRYERLVCQLNKLASKSNSNG